MILTLLLLIILFVIAVDALAAALDSVINKLNNR